MHSLLRTALIALAAIAMAPTIAAAVEQSFARSTFAASRRRQDYEGGGWRSDGDDSRPRSRSSIRKDPRKKTTATRPAISLLPFPAKQEFEAGATTSGLVRVTLDDDVAPGY